MMLFPRRLAPALLAFTLAFLACARLAGQAALPFPHAASDLKPDPAVKFGALPNGLRYAVRANAEPKGRASLRLLVLAGSFHETDNQRGLAHFLEHMAFNGSTHYPPGTLVEYLQRMGMSFGADTNASTGFDRTLYLLELPKADEPTLAEGFRVLQDYAGGLFLKAEEIERERGIILSEKRDRDSVEYRTQIAQFEFALGSTLLPARIPIGVPEVIEKAGRDRFVDYWDTWYRPELMAVIAVGDFDAAAIEKTIVANFAALKARAPARADPSRGDVTDFAGLRTHYHPEAEASSTAISLTAITPFAFEADTAARRVSRLPRRLALSILNRRLSVLAKKENAPFTSASASVQEAFDLFREAGVDLDCKPEQWQAALAVGEQELRRALEHGFTTAELKEAAANIANQLDQAAKTAATRHHGGLANSLAVSLTSRVVFTAPADDLALLQPALDQVTPADCLAALRADFAAKGRFLFVSGNVKIPGDAKAAIAAAYETSRAVKVEPPAAEAELKWAYTDFGPAGKVAKREHVADLDLTLVTFANGVRLNLKKTPFEANRIRVVARVGRGMLTQPLDRPGLANLAGGTFVGGGLGQHSADDLRRILAGKNVAASFQAGQESFPISGGTTKADLLLQLQLIAARLTDPGYRPEALRQARKGLEEAYISYEHTLNGPLALEVSRLLVSGDPRFGMPPKEQMLARNLDEVRAWLTPELTRGKIEVSLVGDLDLDASIDAVARTLGALPARADAPLADALKKVAFPAEPFAKEYRVDTEIPRGLVRTYWPTTDGIDITRTRRLNLLGAVLNDRLRLKLREELGAAYSPDAGSIASDVFPGYGYLLTHVEIDPAQAAKVSEILLTIGDDLAKNGISDDELKRAREPIVKSMEQSLRDNGYWLNNVLARAQEKPETLDWSRTRLADINSVTAAELSALAKKYFPRPRASKVAILPKEKK